MGENISAIWMILGSFALWKGMDWKIYYITSYFMFSYLLSSLKWLYCELEPNVRILWYGIGGLRKGRKSVANKVNSDKLSSLETGFLGSLAAWYKVYLSYPPFHVSVQTSHFCHEMKQHASTPEPRLTTRTVHLDFQSPEQWSKCSCIYINPSSPDT